MSQSPSDKQQRAFNLLRGLHKAVLDLSEHFEKPVTDDNVTRWLALNSAQSAVRDFLASPPTYEHTDELDALIELVRLKRIRERLEATATPGGPGKEEQAALVAEYNAGKEIAWDHAKACVDAARSFAPSATATTDPALALLRRRKELIRSIAGMGVIALASEWEPKWQQLETDIERLLATTDGKAKGKS